ncbi:thiol-disulfide oxidoreductase [Paremcibacter congregatus]|uniref:Thiol-disulfide oxidoreductase n=2 Tax=Paremcibacter congregatus TaxID=2043170 RepID=A0A2G4YTK4_9PROT|nr:thiol-disulfide oxidoreductase [Paremcibacter congregatus]QDE26593.1 DsbA family protein [Paremcibacter congregatus]
MMIKQLYKRNTTKLSLIFAAVLSVFLGLFSVSMASAQESGFLNKDMVIGDPNAPIEIIEYASTTCPHCATFNNDILPELKKKYVETGKVKIIFRNYVFQQPFDIFSSSLNRCVDEKKFFPLLGLYFKRQHDWMKYKEFNELKSYGKYAALGFAKGEAIKIAKIAGMKESEAYQCLARTDVLEFLMNGNKEAQEKYDINSTPSIIVNGKKLDAYDFETIEKAILAESN